MPQMDISFFYVGSSLLAPLKSAEQELNREYKLDLRITACNFGSPLNDSEWQAVDNDLKAADIVFVIHVMDGENSARLIAALERHKNRHSAVIAINCMSDLMRHTRMGRLDVSRLIGGRRVGEKGKGEGVKTGSEGIGVLTAAASWMGRQVRGGNKTNGRKNGHGQYLKFIDRLPGVLKFVPSAGGLRDVKNYLNIFCYFLQPTPANIRAMVLCALKEYVPDERLKKARIKLAPPAHLPSVAIYHPDATKLFETFADYQKWYRTNRPKSKVQSPKSQSQHSESTYRLLDPESTVGLLLMRPQVVSQTTKHYDALIRAIEAEGLSVIPALSTLMDNRKAVTKFFVEDAESKVQSPKSKVNIKDQSKTKGRRPPDKPLTTDQ